MMPVDDAVEVILDALPAFLCHMMCICENVSGGCIPARNRRKLGGKMCSANLLC